MNRILAGLSVLAAVILIYIPLYAQVGMVTVSGVVLDPDGNAVAGADVTVSVGSLAVVTTARTDAKGNFSASILAPGNYVLHVERAPFVETVTEFALSGGTPSPLRVTMAPGLTDTPETPPASEGDPVPLTDTAASFMPGVSGTQPGFNIGLRRERTTIRGFETALFGHGGISRDGFPLADTSHSLANIERTEVHKGGPSFINGRSEPGGYIHLVSRLAEPARHHSLEQHIGSFGHVRSILDTTGPVPRTSSLLYRATLEYHGSESFRDEIAFRRVFAAPALNWKRSNNTQVDISGRYQYDKTPSDYGIPAVGAGIAEIPISRFLGEPGDLARYKLDQEAAAITHRVNDRWTARARAARYNARGDVNETFVQSLDESTNVATRQLYRAPSGAKSYHYGGDLTGLWTTRSITHNVLIGANHYRRNFFENGMLVGGGANPTPINILNPVYGTFEKDPAFENQPNSPFQSNERWWNLSLQDQMTVAEGWRVLVGARLDRVAWEQSHSDDGLVDADAAENKFSPQAGVLYQPLSYVSFFANYSRPFGGPNISVDNFGGTLPSRTSRQAEGGVRTQWFDDRLEANGTYFYVIQKNIAQPQTALPGGPSMISDRAHSRGAEVDLVGRPFDFVDVTANYTYTNAKYTDDPLFQGNVLPNVARHLGRFWAQARLDRFGLSGFGAGAGLLTTSKRFGDHANSFVIPGYERIDMGLSYARRVSQSLFTVRVNVSNLFDSEHFVAADPRPAFARTSVMPGAPRMVTVGLRVER
jgi:iron complex outermembrane receptor protein